MNFVGSDMPRQTLIAVGGELANISLKVKANRLLLEKRKSPAEAR